MKPKASHQSYENFGTSQIISGCVLELRKFSKFSITIIRIFFADPGFPVAGENHVFLFNPIQMPGR
jgi:hypothetical protein